MGRYKVEFSKTAAKNYKRLPREYKTLIDLTLSRLSEGMPVDIKAIAGEKDIYRLRVGRYRILLTVVGGSVLVIKIGSRGDVYK